MLKTSCEVAGGGKERRSGAWMIGWKTKPRKKKNYGWIERLDGEVDAQCVDVLGDGRDERFGCTNEGLANMTLRLPTPVGQRMENWRADPGGEEEQTYKWVEEKDRQNHQWRGTRDKHREHWHKGMQRDHTKVTKTNTIITSGNKQMTRMEGHK